MEPTIQSTIEQDIHNKPTIKFIVLMIMGVVGLIGAYFVINNTIKTENRAATSAPAQTCREGAYGGGYCEIPSIPDGTNLDNLYLVVTRTCVSGGASSTTIEYRAPIKEYNGTIHRYSDQFDVLPNCTYACSIELEKGASETEICASKTSSLTCESCKCEDKDGLLCPSEEAKKDIPIEWLPKFTSNNACFECTKIVVKETNGTYEEVFDCNGQRKARVHQAIGETCRNYTVVAIGTDPQNGGAEVIDGGNCKCEFNVCCPECSPPEEIKYETYFDPPTLSGKKNPYNDDNIFSGCKEWPIPGTNPQLTINCNFTPPTACIKAGGTLTATLPPINQLPPEITMCYDDIRDGNPLDNEFNGHCVTYDLTIPGKYEEAQKHLYLDAGKYDIALWCPLKKDASVETNNVAVCIKRVTVACEGGGGPPGGGGSPTPNLSGTPTPTSGKCPIINLEGICI